LSSPAFTVAIAGSGEDGVALAASALPDLILMDIQLPGIDGYAALEQIPGDRAAAHMPVVALAAFVMARDHDRVLSSGFDGHLEKPINVRDFPTEVRRHLPEAQGRQ
jgi:two-component system cell cycle response regulator DivK